MSHNSVRAPRVRRGDPVHYVAFDAYQGYCEGTELVGGKLRRFRFPNTYGDSARLTSDRPQVLRPNASPILQVNDSICVGYSIRPVCREDDYAIPLELFEARQDLAC